MVSDDDSTVRHVCSASCARFEHNTFLSAQRKQLKPAGVGEGMRMPQKSIWPTRGCIYGQFQFGGELNNASRMIMNILSIADQHLISWDGKRPCKKPQTHFTMILWAYNLKWTRFWACNQLFEAMTPESSKISADRLQKQKTVGIPWPSNHKS